MADFSKSILASASRADGEVHHESRVVGLKTAPEKVLSDRI